MSSYQARFVHLYTSSICFGRTIWCSTVKVQRSSRNVNHSENFSESSEQQLKVSFQAQTDY